jgi:hypothetical protein
MKSKLIQMPTALLMVAGLSACGATASQPSPSASVSTTANAATPSVDSSSVPTATPEVTNPAAVPETGEALSELLTYLVQEEKLAYDLYTVLASQTNVRQFQNIVKSEAKHIDSVQALLNTYGIDDPTQGLAPGEFTDPELQDLYAQLLEQGLSSRTGAVDVGIAVEELDISDIEKMLVQQLPSDVTQVLNNLLDGSKNHLAAFNRA